MSKADPHVPVLLSEVLSIFQGKEIHIFIDGTLGAGGHAAAILEAHPEITHFIGIDQDPQALAIARNKLVSWKQKVTLLKGNFVNVASLLNHLNIYTVDGILLDLGVSSMQLDVAERGFSFMREGPLDMRMDPGNPLTAAEIVNTWSEQDLGCVFRDFGEEKKWRAAARLIVRARSAHPILTTGALANLLLPLFPIRKKGIHPLTLIFQALRICVNQELEVLDKGLHQALEVLAPGGRLAVISFHSLEDRIVKDCFRFEASDKQSTTGLEGLFLDKEPTVSLLTRKPLTESEENKKSNPRSRSAKLRAVEKI